jgi:hypothetical protein
MAKEYFQDIVPPHTDSPRGASHARRLHPISSSEQGVRPETNTVDPLETDYVDDTIEDDSSMIQPRGIRNIQISGRRPRGAMLDTRDMPSLGRTSYHHPGRSLSKGWIWILAIISLTTLGALGLFVFRDTTVTLSPHSRSVTFDDTSQFIAYSRGTVGTSSLSYQLSKMDMSDVAVVSGTGAIARQMKASGSITVYNNYSTGKIRLLKDTRFESPTGLIFRTPANIVVPGKHGVTPGSVSVIVEAEEAGQKYNIEPVSRFNVPGLNAKPSMYGNIYARSFKPMSGGFAGNQMGVDDAVRKATVLDIHNRLQEKVAHYVSSLNTATTTTFSDLVQITYIDEPDVDDGNGNVQIHQTVHVEVPVFPSNLLASAIAQTAGIDSNHSELNVQKGVGYGVRIASSTPLVLGIDAINFSLLGQATLIWSIDTSAIRHALAGRDRSVFETIIGGFPAVETARARIEPFWKNTFPTDPAKIHVIIENPSTGARALNR